MRALGVHVFAGGFTMGVMQRAEVIGQLEIHDFGRDTVEKQLKLPFINADRWEDWPKYSDVDLVYGNPRCTGFSSMTSGYDDTIHGPFAKCTQDIRDLVEYGISIDAKMIAWESVQQAWSVGRPLLDVLVEQVKEAGYRVCHLFLNAATFGNSQHRRRYFFFAYKRDKNFNVVPPPLLDRHATVRDFIEAYQGYAVKEGRIWTAVDYDPDTYDKRTVDEKAAMPHLLPRESLNCLARRGGPLTPRYQERWDLRLSQIPFSLHSITRLDYDGSCPTLAGSCGALVHPELDRTLTVRELSRLMGWPEGITPMGPRPAAQIAKGICPEVGVWLAEQAQLYLNDHWGKEDWSSRWNGEQWVGDIFSDDIAPPDEKVINMTMYAPQKEKDEIECITMTA